METASRRRRLKVPVSSFHLCLSFSASGGLKPLEVWVIELRRKARLLPLLMSAIRFEFKLRRISVIDPAAAGMLARIIKQVEAATTGGDEMSFIDVYFLSLLLEFCGFFFPPRRRPVQRGRRVSHGATLESTEQPVQSQTQLHHLIDGSVSDPLHPPNCRSVMELSSIPRTVITLLLPPSTGFRALVGHSLNSPLSLFCINLTLMLLTKWVPH